MNYLAAKVQNNSYIQKNSSIICILSEIFNFCAPFFGYKSTFFEKQKKDAREYKK